MQARPLIYILGLLVSCARFPANTAQHLPEILLLLGTQPVRTSTLVQNDFNGDGFADLAVSATQNQGLGAANKGAVYVFYGSASGITLHPEAATTYSCTGPPDCTVIQNPENEGSGGFGEGLGSAGDVNNDGYGDLVVGATRNQGSGTNDKGVAYVFYGSSTGLKTHAESATPYSCSGPPDCSVFQNPDNEVNGFFGFSVAGAGDVNRDGFADVIVGAVLNTAADIGAFYIFYGTSGGITNHPSSATPYACSGPPDCTLVLNPDNESSGNFGYTVSGAGDVNRDGYSDVLVAALTNQGTGANDKGIAYVFYGSASGITQHSLASTTYPCNGPPDCTAIQNPENQAGTYFGNGLSAAGDVNRDGYGDVIIGGFQNEGSGVADKGVAYVFYGSANGVTSHPGDATPYSCNGPPDCTTIQNPDNESQGYFGYDVTGGADLNQDGYDDVAISAYQNQGAGNGNKGMAYVFFGASTGITLHVADANPYSCSGAPDCVAIQNPDDEISGSFGYSLSFVGDINKDGRPDLAVGGYKNQGPGIADKGSAYLFFGTSTGITSHPSNATPYTCSGSPDCSIVQNPDNESQGYFGFRVR
ncbi:MAG: integrin alpha [Spirochaetia bacterium]|nr:integrin alpha [Spirochaetia bacterium]